MKDLRTQFADVQKTNSIFSALKNVKEKDLLLRKHGLFTFLNKGFLNSVLGAMNCPLHYRLNSILSKKCSPYLARADV